MTRRRGRKVVKDRDLAHLTLPTDPEELTPAERAWVRLVLSQLPQPRPVVEGDTIFYANDPESTVFTDRPNGSTGLPRPWFKQ